MLTCSRMWRASLARRSLFSREASLPDKCRRMSAVETETTISFNRKVHGFDDSSGKDSVCVYILSAPGRMTSISNGGCGNTFGQCKSKMLGMIIHFIAPIDFKPATIWSRKIRRIKSRLSGGSPFEKPPCAPVVGSSNRWEESANGPQRINTSGLVLLRCAKRSSKGLKFRSVLKLYLCQLFAVREISWFLPCRVRSWRNYNTHRFPAEKFCSDETYRFNQPHNQGWGECKITFSLVEHSDLGFQRTLHVKCCITENGVRYQAGTSRIVSLNHHDLSWEHRKFWKQAQI